MLSATRAFQLFYYLYTAVLLTTVTSQLHNMSQLGAMKILPHLIYFEASCLLIVKLLKIKSSSHAVVWINECMILSEQN